MTDKQIIIDGVDVSKCEAIDNDSGWCSFWEENCAKNPDYIHKKYYRKEQECEMWKNLTIENGAVALKYQKQLDNLKAELQKEKDWHKSADEITKKNSEYVIQLKAENEELKGIRDRNFLHALEEQKRADKYEKTLKEIKELCQKHIKAEKIVMANDILQKISESEGNDENP